MFPHTRLFWGILNNCLLLWKSALRTAYIFAAVTWIWSKNEDFFLKKWESLIVLTNSINHLKNTQICSHIRGCPDGYSRTVCFYENLHLELSISLQVLHQVDQKAKVSFLEKMAIFIIDAIRIYLNYFPHTTLFM